jgi:hypothetical protein
MCGKQSHPGEEEDPRHVQGDPQSRGKKEREKEGEKERKKERTGKGETNGFPRTQNKPDLQVFGGGVTS